MPENPTEEDKPRPDTLRIYPSEVVPQICIASSDNRKWGDIYKGCWKDKSFVGLEARFEGPTGLFHRVGFKDSLDDTFRVVRSVSISSPLSWTAAGANP